jgi:hypothetical protein
MRLQRIYTDVPNQAFNRIVQQYAFQRGCPVFTVDQQHAALWNYIRYAIDLN